MLGCIVRRGVNQAFGLVKRAELRLEDRRDEAAHERQKIVQWSDAPGLAVEDCDSRSYQAASIASP